MSGFTVEIQAGNADGTIWQAMAPAENIDRVETASDVAFDVLHNQNVLDEDGVGHWRIVVWIGTDADTSCSPDYTLDDEEYRDAVAEALTRAE